jgi:hypothetical protein
VAGTIKNFWNLNHLSRYPPPLQIDGFVVQIYALYFAQTMLLGLIDMGIKKPS